jgi:hypothetical protein
MSPILIALHGEIGAGKDTVAGILTEGHNFIRTAFADLIRAELVDAYALPDEQIFTDRVLKEVPTDFLALAQCANKEFVKSIIKAYSHEKDGTVLSAFLSEPRSPRWAMERWGVEFRREYQGQPDYWIDSVRAIVSTAFNGGQSVVISDLRDIREYLFVKELNGEAWVIDSASSYKASTHSTSRPLQVEFDKRLSNKQDDLDGLRKQVITYLEERDCAPRVTL